MDQLLGGWSGGLNKLDLEKETFTHFQHDPNDPRSLSHNSIFSIFEDRSGVLWIGTRGGVTIPLDLVQVIM